MVIPRAEIIAAAGLGSALGAVARYGIAVVVVAADPLGFPWATLLANGLGSLLIGFIAATGAPYGRWPLSEPMRHFLVTGFCGGFTTFSIFSLEAISLAAGGAAGLAASYVGASLIVWMAGVWLGWTVGERL